MNLIENRDDDSVWKHLSLREDILIECQLPNHSIRFEPIISSSLNDYKIKFAQFLLDYNLINGSSITYKYLRMLTERLINLFVKLNLYERYRVRFYLDQSATTGIHLQIEKTKIKTFFHLINCI